MELLLVLAVMSVLFIMTAPAMNTIRGQAALRAARQQFSASLSAARSSAVQKARWATFSVRESTVRVSVRTGVQGTPHLVVAPLDLLSSVGVQVRPLTDTPDSLLFNSRGLLAPTPAHTLRYQLLRHGVADTLCLSPGGIVLPRGCSL